MASQPDCEKFVYKAKIAEQAERYEEMVEAMKSMVNLDMQLTIEERNLLAVGYKNVIGARCASWRILFSIEQKEDAKGNEMDVRKIKEYRQKVESELSDICNDIMVVIDGHLIPSATAGESSVFYYKMKGDYYRYFAEFKAGNEKKEVAEKSLKAYQGSQYWGVMHTSSYKYGYSGHVSVPYYSFGGSYEVPRVDAQRRVWEDAVAEH